MVDALQIIGELQRRYALDWDGQAPVQDDIDAWSGGSLEAENAIYDQLGAELARGYFERRYSFEFCDTLMNHLSALITMKQFQEPIPPWPHLFWRVYEAFDAGEFHRRPDKSDNPVAEYTDPEIADIVRELEMPPTDQMQT